MISEITLRQQLSYPKRRQGPTRRLTIQLEPEAKAAAGARIGKGAYSDGKSQGMARRPMAKKKLGQRPLGQRVVDDGQTGT